MARKKGPIELMVREAIVGRDVVTRSRIEELRAKSEKGISVLKRIFWVALGIFNLMVWYPFTTPIPETLRWSLAVGSLLIAVIFPILGIRRHRSRLYQLEECSQGPKRRKSDDLGRLYMDKVKKQGRFFVRAEFDALQEESVPN